MKVRFGCFSAVGGRPYQEDRLVAHVDLEGNSGHFFAVFDGHGGAEVSDFLSKTFHEILSEHAKIKTQPLTALQECWAGFDDRCYQACQKVEAKDRSKSFPQDGSTGTVCYIAGSDVYILNCGDSAAYSVAPGCTSSALLTEDHGTLNVAEVARCEKAGGYLKADTYSVSGRFPFCCIPKRVVGKPRVYPGGLMVTRAFGDFHAKVEYLGGRRGVVVHDHGRIKYVKASSQGLRFLVLASDGVWDGLSIDQVTALISQFEVTLADDHRAVTVGVPAAVPANAVIPLPSSSRSIP